MTKEFNALRLRALELDINPTIEFGKVEGRNALMCVNVSYFVNEQDIILASKCDEVIHVDLDTLSPMVLSYVSECGFSMAGSYVSFLLLHEFRHIWQCKNGFDHGRHYYAIKLSKYSFSTNQDLHKAECEQDADRYARWCAPNKRIAEFDYIFYRLCDDKKRMKEAKKKMKRLSLFR